MAMPRLRLGTRVNFENPNDINADLPVYVDGKSRCTGAVMVGQSGSGKSELQKNLFAQDSMYPVSKVLIDPSGSSAPDCYSISRGKKTTYISLDHPGSLNFMELPYESQVLAAIGAEVLNQCVKEGTKDTVSNLSPNMHNIFNRAVLRSIEKNHRSLLAVRDHIAAENSDRQSRDAVLQRLDYVLSDERIARILCGPNHIEWGEMIAKGESLILDCFGLGAAHRTFVGNVVAQGIVSYFIYERPSVYRPVILYIDEFHGFYSSTMNTVLREARKYRVGTVLATTDLAAFDDRAVRVLMNVGTIISFRVSYREAQYLARELRVDIETLQSLQPFHFAFKTPHTRGIARAPRPIFIPKRIKPPTAASTTDTSMHNNKPAPHHAIPPPAAPPAPSASTPPPAPPTTVPKAEWFTLEPYQPHETTNSEAVPVDAPRAETTPSRTVDG